MIEILEIKHLKHYLNHGLVCHAMGQCIKGTEYDDKPVPKNYILKGLVNNKASILSGVQRELIDFYELFPILRPLEDLLNHDLDFWIELGELLQTMNPDHFTRALIDKTNYALSPQKWLEVSDFLDSRHFDWRFDLIRNKLAIDINSLKTENEQAYSNEKQ